MTFPDPKRVEAAARAMADADANDWSALSWAAQASYERLACAAAPALFPELAKGTAWIAPWEATPDMCMAISFGPQGESGPAGMWRDVRDAYLNNPKDE